MAKGKFKEKRESATQAQTLEQLAKRVAELEAENEQLRKQNEHDHQHHAWQLAQMFDDILQKSSPKVRELEEQINLLNGEIVTLKRALRGITD